MGSQKGIPHRYHSKEFKLRAVQLVLSGKSAVEVGKEISVRGSLVCTWVRQYQEGGEPALEPKRKPGNSLCKYSSRKELSEVEQLRYELAKAKVELARLKKVYEAQRRCCPEKK